MNTHVTIIGSGMAGVAAALAAESRGANVTLITGRPGATALSSGAWDTGSLDPFRDEEQWENLLSPQQMVKKTVQSKPDHPYAIVNRALNGSDLASVLEQAFGVLAERMPYRPVGSIAEPMVLLTPLGSLKYTSYADPAQAPGNLLKMRKVRLLIAGIPGLANFPVSLIGKVLSDNLQRFPERVIDSVAEKYLEIDGVPQHSLSPFAIAQRLEDEKSFANLVRVLKQSVRETQATHVLLPPVIGIEQSARLIRQLSESVGAVCFESLGTVPSVPGLRRHRALETVLRKSQVTVVGGEVTDYESVDKHVTELVVRTASGESALEVERVVLATGRFVGGGIIRAAEMREAVFQLPVFVDGKVVTDTFVGNLVHRQYMKEQPLFTAGVKVDRDLHPLNQWGEPVFENLHAAGSVLGGAIARRLMVQRPAWLCSVVGSPR